jgi:hypothetical protein
VIELGTELLFRQIVEGVRHFIDLMISLDHELLTPADRHDAVSVRPLFI